MKYYTVKEVAKMLNVSPKTIYRLKNEGKFKVILQVRDGFRFPEKEIERYIKENTRLL